MSGYTEDVLLRRGALEWWASFLPKPFTPKDVARKVQMLACYESQAKLKRASVAMTANTDGFCSAQTRFVMKWETSSDGMAQTPISMISSEQKML